MGLRPTFPRNAEPGPLPAHFQRTTASKMPRAVPIRQEESDLFVRPSVRPEKDLFYFLVLGYPCCGAKPRHKYFMFWCFSVFQGATEKTKTMCLPLFVGVGEVLSVFYYRMLVLFVGFVTWSRCIFHWCWVSTHKHRKIIMAFIRVGCCGDNRQRLMGRNTKTYFVET